MLHTLTQIARPRMPLVGQPRPQALGIPMLALYQLVATSIAVYAGVVTTNLWFHGPQVPHQIRGLQNTESTKQTTRTRSQNSTKDLKGPPLPSRRGIMS